MPYDWDRLARGIKDARGRLGITQKELARRSRVDISTIKNLEGRHTFGSWPRTISSVESALGKPEGWARALAEGRPLPPEPDAPATLVVEEDSFVLELRKWPGLSQQMRDRLVEAYLQSKRERMEAAAAAAERLVRPLAEAAARAQEEPDQPDYPESTAS